MDHSVVRRVAEELLTQYDQEFDASHLTWQDFEPEAQRLVDVMVEAQALALASAG
jgi:ribosomal protein S17E